MKALKYIVRRLIMLVPVLIGVSLMTFVISHIIPADPVEVALGPDPNPAAITALRAEWGLDKPLPIQYLRYLAGLLRGDLGTSIHTNRSVLKDLLTYFPATLELSTAAILVCLGLGIPFGIVAAIRKDRPADHLTRIISLLGISVPVFWLGLLMLLLLYFKLDLLPGSGRLAPQSIPPAHITGLYILDSLLTADWSLLWESIAHLIMPAFCLGFAITGVVARMMRSSMLGVLGEEYIKTAHAKGLRPRKVVYQHALRNSILPVITISGVLYGQILAGTVLTETIFSWPGIGLYAVKSIIHLDFQPIMGFTILVAIIRVVVNLGVDILYVLFDPRIRLE